MKLLWFCGHSSEREEQYEKKSQGKMQRQVREKVKCVLSPRAKIREN